MGKLSAFVLAIAILSTTALVVQADVIFEDNFATMDPTWGDPTEFVSVKENKMVLQPPLDGILICLNQGSVFTDLDATIKMRIASANKGQWSGFAFWAKDTYNYYAFVISEDGRYAVWRLVENRWLYPVGSRANDAIKKGADQVNDMRVVIKGRQATISANGVELITFQGQPPKGSSQIGIYGQSGKETRSLIEYTELKVSEVAP